MTEPRLCRSPDHCQVPVGPNGWFCQNHFKLLDNATRHVVLAYPPRPGKAPEGRNQMLHKAIFELRRLLGVSEPVDEPGS